MQDVAGELIRVCEHTFNERYPRPVPKVLDLTADNLNNRALSLWVYGHTANLWDLMKGELVTVLKGHNSALLSTMFTPDGDFALTGGEDGTIRLWNLRTVRCLRTFDGAGWEVSAVSRLEDGRFVAFSSGGAFACGLQIAIGVAQP